MDRVIISLKGGLGNQLFQYATGRRLAHKNNAVFMIDTSYFKRDLTYKRKYLLDKFMIDEKRFKLFERLGLFEKHVRFILKKISKKLPFEKRFYIEEEKLGFDFRLLNKKVNKILFLDGYWQSENYFKDIEDLIKMEFQLKIIPEDPYNQQIMKKINNCNSVCIHIRFFDKSGVVDSALKNYYLNAIKYIKNQVSDPYYFIFSDVPERAFDYLPFIKGKMEVVYNNKGEENSYKDLWLMSQCQHFIISNSTFSWWAAWLAKNKNKIVIAPKIKREGVGAWGFDGLIPKEWILL